MGEGLAETEVAHCLNCGRAPHLPIGWRRSPRHVACTSCGLVFRTPRPTEAAMLAFYASHYYEGVVDGWRAPEGRAATRGESFAAWLAPFVGAGTRVLEIGCGDGMNLTAIRDRLGCEVVGLEPSHLEVSRAAATHGMKIVQGGIRDLDRVGPPFDAVVLSHVLEHFHDPLDALVRCHGALAPGGVLLVEVPNVLGPSAAKRLSTWLAPEHLYYFSTATLTHLLGRACFAATRAEADGAVRVLARAVAAPVDVPRPRELAQVAAAFARHELVYWPRVIARRLRAKAGMS